MNNSRVPPLSVNPNAFNDLMEFGRQDVNARANQIREELIALQTVRQAQAKFEEQNKDSLVSRLNLSPGTRDANAVNLGASIVASGARLAGHIASLPNQIAATHDEAQLRQEHFEAYRRMKEGRASERDMLVLSGSTYLDDRKNNPTIQQSIENGMRNRAAGRNIVEAADSVGRLVHQGNREQLIEDVDSGFDDQWERVKEGWSQLGVGQDREGWTNITSGVGRIIANAGVSAYNNPAGAFEYIAEAIPQVAIGLFGRVGMGLLTTSNIGYALDEHSKGLQKYQEENNGAMPSPEQQERMATHAVSLVLAEQLSDVVQLRGIGKILGTTDDAVKTGFKQALRNYATAVPKAMGVEALTEGWQTYAEGEANLEGSTAQDIHRGAVIGGIAGGGVAAVSPALAVVGAAKDMHSQYKEARNKAEETLKRNEADRARVAEAEKTGDVSVFLNRADRQKYDPSLALEVLFRQDTSKYTPEQKQARQDQIRQVINSFERDVAVRQAAMQRGDSPELKAELAELRQEAQDYPNDPSIQEDITALEAKMQAPPLEPKELQALQQEVADIQPKLEKARSIYQQLLNEQTGQREINTNVDESVQAVKAAADVAAAAPAVSNIRILSMASPGAVSTQQAQALINSGKLSQDDMKYFRLYINAETSLNQAKNMKQVSREVMEGDPQQRQKGLTTYRKNVAAFLADGNKYLARREMSGLVRFIDSHSAKLAAMNAALESSKKTKRTYHIFKDANGLWQSKELPEGTKNFKRKKGEYLIDVRSSQQMVAAVAQELQAMADTQVLLDSQINQVNAKGVNNATTPSENNTTINSNATSGDTGGIEASSQESGIGTNEGAAAATEAESNDVTDDSTNTSQETAAPEIAQETTEAGEITESTDAAVSNQPEAVSTEGTANVAPKVTLEGSGPYVAKDQAKSDKATKFIGRGSERSSTARYANSWGNLANTGNYTAEDIVFVSAEGSRNGRVDPDFVEIQRAIDAGATIVTDVVADRNRPYNIGERQVAAFLEKQGYQEVSPGTWKNTSIGKTQEQFIEETPPWEELPSAPPREFYYPTEQEQSIIDNALEKVKAVFGSTWATVNKVLVHTGGAKQLGTYYYNDGSFSFNKFMLESGIASLNLNPEQAAYIVAVHELAHGRDQELGFFSQQTSSLFVNGAVYTEAKAAMLANPVLAKMLDKVVFRHEDPKKVASELYAQLYTIYAFDKELLREHIPTGFAFVEQDLGVREEVAPEGHRSYDGRRDTGNDQESSTSSQDGSRVLGGRDGEGTDGRQPEVSDSGKLSIFDDTHPHTEIIRNQLSQSPGKEVGTQRPLVLVKNFLESLASSIEAASKYLKNPLNENQERALRFFVSKAPQWSKSLQKTLSRNTSSDYYWKNVAEYFMTSDPETRTKLDMDQNMKTAIVAAAMSYVADSYGSGLFNNKKSINKILGRKDAKAPVSRYEYQNLAFAGSTRNMAAEAIGKRVIEALGLKGNSKTARNMMSKLSSSLGAYAIEMLIKEGILESVSISKETWGSLLGKDIKHGIEFVRLARMRNNPRQVTPAVKDVVAALKGTSNVLEKLFGVEGTHKLPSFVGPDYKQKTLKKRKTGVPSKLFDILKGKSQEPHFLRIRMYEVVSVMDPQMFLKILGAKTIDGSMHINNRLSQEATNEGIERDYWAGRDFIEGAWTEQGLEQPIFIEPEVWGNQRVGNRNTVLNPQTSHYARHLLTKGGWKSTIDPDNVEDMNRFKLRVLEGFGVRTHEQDNEKSLKEWKTVVEENVELQEAVNLLFNLRTNPGTELTLEQQQKIVNVTANKEGMHSLDALMALVDLKLANGEPFTSELVGEIDGVTNGPMATNLLTGAATTVGQLFKMLNKGGFYTQTDGFKNYNAYRGSEGAMDLYESVISKVIETVRFLSTDEQNKKMFAPILAITGQLDTADGKVEKAARNLIKRPITALHFGSSTKKAVDGMANDFIGLVFSQIEKYHKDSRDVRPLIKHINDMLTYGDTKEVIPLNTSSKNLMEYEFSEKEIDTLKEYFTGMMEDAVVGALETEFASVIQRRDSMNGSARLAFNMYQSVYQAMKTELLKELAAKGEIPVNKKGVPIWDLSPEQEAVLEKRMAKVRPVMGTAMSKLSDEIQNGLSISQMTTNFLGSGVLPQGVTPQTATEQQLFEAAMETALYRSEVNLSSESGSGKTRPSYNSLVRRELDPGVAAFSASIHSFDSAVSHMAAALSEALNIHDAHLTGVLSFEKVARNLNKAFWGMALLYSPTQAIYESLERTTLEMLDVLNSPDTSLEVRIALKQQLADELTAYNKKKMFEKKPVFKGTLGEFLVKRLQEAKDTAFHADQIRLGVLKELAYIDQYALQGGEYQVTDEDRQAAADALSKLTRSLPVDLVNKVKALDGLFDAVPEVIGSADNIFTDQRPSIQEVLGMSDSQAMQLMNAALASETLPQEIKENLERISALMSETKMSLVDAASMELNDPQAAELVEYLASIKFAAKSTPFGVLGTPAVAPESDVVAMMEDSPEMSGQEAVKKLWSVLQERGDFPQKAFYGKLLQMTSKVLGDNIKVKYVTPQTAPDEVLASPTTESRGWYVVNNGTIYVLHPEFAASGLTAELLVHELVHAAIEHLIENPSTAAQKQAVQELKELLKEAKKYTQANNITKFDDALSSVHELVAWGMSNAEFQAEVLNHITMPETTQSNRVVKGLKKFIDSLVKLMFPDMAKPEKGFVSGFTALVGNTTALYREAGKHQSNKVGRAVEEANRIYSMATGNNNQPNAQQIQKYTTEQVFTSLGAMSPGLSSDFVLKLQERLNDVVNAFHGPFGAIKAEMEQRVGSTALDAWANAMARGELPFHGKVLNAGVKFTAQEGYVAEQIEAVMDELLQDKHAANSMIYKELEKVYLQARDQLKGQIAPELYNFVFIPQKTLGNRSDYMSRFVSLALSHEGFAKSLEFATRKISLDTRGKTFMQRLEILWRAAVDWLSARMTGTYSGQTAGARTEALVRKLVQIEARNKDKISSKNSLLEYVDTFGDKAKDSVDGVRSSIVKAAQSNFVRENRFLAVQTAGKVLTAAMRLDAVANGINAFRNSQIKGKHGQAMQLLNYVKGPGQWLNAMSRIATHIQGERKHIMSDVSKAVMSGFKDGGSYLTTAAKKAISAHLLRTGTFYLLDKFKPSGIQTLLEDSKALDQAIQDEIGLLSSFPEVHYYIAQAKGLAWKQVTGWAGVEEQNLNAHNIARLYNTGNPPPAHAKDAQPTIERLIALYGLQYAKQEDSLGVSTLLDVMRTENARGAENGIEMALATHRHLINDAKERIFKDSEALMIHGYLPEVTNPHIAFEVVRDDDEAKALIEQGYVFEMAIALDPHDPDKRIPRMYVLNGGGLPRWASGAFSTTGTNAKGKTKHGKYFNSNDPIGVENMQSMNAIHADKKQAVLNQFKPNPGFKPSREQNRLVPLLNAEGKKVDYRYTMKEVYRDKILERNNDFDHLLGVLASSTYDKEASSEQNAKLVEALHEHYRKDFGRNPQNYVLIGKDSEDPELKEIWDLLPSNTKRDVKAQWGMAGMRVPKEMVTPLFGYRKATIADAFKKDHRNAMEQGFVDTFNKDPRKALEQGFVDVVHMLMRLNGMRKGMNHVQQRIYQRKAYAKVRKFEDAWEEIVREIKDTIVVKSAVVLWGNMTSNFSVLLMNGLSFKEVIMYQKEALNAVIDYERDRDALAQLQLRLNTAHGAVDPEDLMAEINRLQDAIDRNPAKELIDAGLLPTIVEDVTMEDDPYSYKSQFAHWIDEKVQNLNPSVVGAGRVLYMTHDTTLYKFLHKSTQYSDFVGRYALYRHETTRKRNPLSKEQALFNASESFVNYDIPLPRLLQYLDDHGLMMFTKFFLSIQRVIVRLMTEKPLEVISTIALNNWLFDFTILTDTAAVVRVGDNPLSAGALGYPGTLDDLATVSAISGLVR